MRTTAKAAPTPINNGFFDASPGPGAGAGFLTGGGASVFFFSFFSDLFSFFSGLSLGDGFLPTS